ncbi:sensor histidine kinase [Streptomyces sp. NPDC005017]|uniref:sensor histidine kinase n=1 Tax=Streptomyces sp. NPDC005017 TaxID=3364706 RepID=UPI0036C15F48
MKPLLLTAATTAVVSAAAVGWAVSAVPLSARAPAGWAGGAAAVVLCVAVTVAVHGLRAARSARTRTRALEEEAARLAGAHASLTAQWQQERQRETRSADTERAALLAQLARERDELTRRTEAERAALLAESAREREGLVRRAEAERARLEDEVRSLSAEVDRAVSDRAAALSATASAAARMQALATGTLADLRAMEERHSDEDVLADLLHLDHRTAQAGRLADSVAVLTGARTGRRWARPIAMESVLRGAMGRISGYQRVRLHVVTGTAVVGHAAEGVMHALAEILDNAANFSPPSAEVHVYVEEVPAGVIVSVEDSGLVMSDIQLRRAEQAVAGDMSELGGLTGTRLGLAVVGRLARKHGLKISFRPSARGGTGVLALIPQDILTQAPAVRPPAPDAKAPAARAAVPAAGAEAAEQHEPARSETEQAVRSPGGLPKRRRGRTLAAAERSRAVPRADAPRTGAAEDIRTRATRFGEFRRAIRTAESASESTGQHLIPGPPDGPDAATRSPAPSPRATSSDPEGDTTS